MEEARAFKYVNPSLPRPMTSPAPSQKKPEAANLTSLHQYRTQTMKDYGLMIEYKHMKQHVPSGIYVLPSFDKPRLWHGVIFIHQGLYRNGIFKFSIHLPDDYNGIGTYPRVEFYTKVFHPFVNPDTNELDLLPKFPTWDPDLHYIVSVLVYMKSIFYTKEFASDLRNVANPRALEMFRRHPESYVEQIDACVEKSLETMYQNEPGSSLRFTKPIPAHEKLRQEFLQQLGGQDTAGNDSASEDVHMTAPIPVMGLDDEFKEVEEGDGESSS
ncbi:hypothetical protein SPRG_15754 [Saprolegnia parasitica CBS 223.65]|uniref:UBC core domain-containing protein n=1 Tax=Saprolegnia parasitica (strain CBS 223.65) TaxID=695850 RepID=A0A067BQE4_SAPPC|nr:hypothetical protein SPRG_15754 [Saprolegnia parasitica CBS 223.65]KDO19005.1 hypothetical protein SPRG_15754 [Saprolegnia parasitica CBS 223.65]|eukprot:XP_012210292.1 hypothetical protein SPRG_15754 [Saprolegnia parasitica CBS 223.65]